MCVKRVNIQNFGPLKSLDFTCSNGINLIIGNNSSGKTWFLKSIYTVLKTIEEQGRGNNPKSIEDIFSERLYWTFQNQRLGDLVTKGSSEKASVDIIFSDDNFKTEFSSSAEKIAQITHTTKTRSANSVFIPAKEVLSLFQVIKKSRDIDKSFGFDDTYLDLARALDISPKQDINKEFSEPMKSLEAIINGKLVFENGSWIYKQGNNKFSIYSMAEGIKKLSIFNRLLENGYISSESIIFIDEPESALHPQALIQFLDIIDSLRKIGIQFFIATHSYFVIKKLVLIAKKHKEHIPLLSFENGRNRIEDLFEGLPADIDIIRQSIELYEEETELAFKSL